MHHSLRAANALRRVPARPRAARAANDNRPGRPPRPDALALDLVLVALLLALAYGTLTLV